MTADLLARRGLAGAQDHGDRAAGGGIVDVDRQEAALVVVAVEERELLMAVDDVERVVDVERDASRRSRASEQLETLLGHPWPFPDRPPKHDLSTRTVIDDWADPAPVTEAEIEVFERCFVDLFDELFGPGA